MNRTWKIAGLVAGVTLVAQVSIADQVILRVPANPSPSGAGAPQKASTRIVIVEEVATPVPSVESKLPFVGESPLAEGKELPRPFVGERPAMKATALPYFGVRPDTQPPTDATSVQIPEDEQKR